MIWIIVEWNISRNFAKCKKWFCKKYFAKSGCENCEIDKRAKISYFWLFLGAKSGIFLANKRSKTWYQLCKRHIVIQIQIKQSNATIQFSIWWIWHQLQRKLLNWILTSSTILQNDDKRSTFMYFISSVIFLMEQLFSMIL